MTIQSLIDSLPPEGGIVHLPAGDFSAESPVVMRDNVILCGEGPPTIIPRVVGNGAARHFGFGLRELIVDGAHNAGYGIDWRNVTNGSIDHVIARNVTYGLVLDYLAYYNDINFLFVDASKVAVEVYGGPNQNTFTGGKWSAPVGLTLNDANGNTFVGVSLEGGDPNMVFRNMSNCLENRFVNVRCEKPGYGPVWINE